MKRTYSKPPLTFAQQVDRLIGRGLVVEDRARAEATLARINYYRLSGYWRIFRRADETFRPDGSFDKALAIYEFDRQLRLVLLDMIERVEIALRCGIAYRLAMDCGTYGHEDRRFFHPRFNHAAWLDELHRETERSREVFVQHFRETYQGFPRLPIWVAAEVMSLGSLSLLFKGLQTPQRAVLARPWGIPHQVLETWLHSLTFVRNVCAHHGRLWNRELAITPSLPRGHAEWDPNHVPNAKRVYSVLCVLRQLSRSDPCGDGWARRVVALLSWLEGQPGLQKMAGVPAAWRSSVFWSGLDGEATEPECGSPA